MTLHLGSVIVGVLLAFGVSTGFVVLLFALVAWRERQARRKAIKEILSRAAVLHD